MKVLFLCKASIDIGLGHLIRSRTFATQLLSQRRNVEITFTVIGDPLVERLLQDVPFAFDIVDDERMVLIDEHFDICFFDMIPISNWFFSHVKDNVDLTVSISPVFDKLLEVDMVFNRTKYHEKLDQFKKRQFFGGFEYSIIQQHCKKIKTSIYEENLELDQFPIAIVMGGGDAANQTLHFLKVLKKCKVPATFWVLLGEGYQHSYNELINVIRKDSKHEIILAKTNRSMWQILRNCILAILPGGITSYEAAYAGLPSINMLRDKNKYFLIRELEEKGLCIYNGVINDENMSKLNSIIESLYTDRKRLMQMHLNSKNLIPENTASNIFNICKRELASKSPTLNPS